MAIASYSDLQTAVANWVHDNSLTALIPDFITLGEKRIHREVRCRDNEAALSVAIASGVAAIPADYVELKYAYIDMTPVRVLERTTARKIFEQYPTRAASGTPKMIATDNGNFIFGCYPSSNWTIKGTYYKNLVTVSSIWNTLATNNPDLYLYAALFEAADYVNDEASMNKWNGKYQKVLNDINSQEQAERGSGSPLRVVAG